MHTQKILFLASMLTSAFAVPIQPAADATLKSRDEKLDWIGKREIEYVGSKRDAKREIEYVGSKREAEPEIEYVGSKREAIPEIEYVGSKTKREIEYVGSK